MDHTATTQTTINITMSITANSMVDIHCHILYETDDGARNIEESLVLSRHIIPHIVQQDQLTLAVKM